MLLSCFLLYIVGLFPFSSPAIPRLGNGEAGREFSPVKMERLEEKPTPSKRRG